MKMKHKWMGVLLSVMGLLQADVKSTTGVIHFYPQLQSAAVMQLDEHQLSLGGNLHSANVHVSSRWSSDIATVTTDANVSSSYTIAATDVAGANLNLHLPTSGDVLGQIITLKNDSLTYSTNLSASNQVIGSANQWTISANQGIGGYMKLIAGAQKWYILDQHAIRATVDTTVSAPSVYHLYSDSGQEFTSEGGSEVSYQMTATTVSSSAPEGSRYKRIEVIDNFSSYRFIFFDQNKSSWSSKTIKFKAKSSTTGLEIRLIDASDQTASLQLSSLFTHDGTWQDVSVPVSSFTGIDLSQLKELTFYRSWNGTFALDVDHLRVE